MGFIPRWKHMLQYTQLPNMESSRFQIEAENVYFNALFSLFEYQFRQNI